MKQKIAVEFEQERTPRPRLQQTEELPPTKQVLTTKSNAHLIKSHWTGNK